MEEQRHMIHVRLKKSLVRQIDHIAVDRDQDRARTVESLLEAALSSKDAGQFRLQAS